jgi:GAF domain-containing protein
MNSKALDPPAAAPGAATDGFHEFERVLASAGLRPALVWLAARSEYRFVGIYRFDGEMLVSVSHFDKQHPDVERVDTVPINASYCCFVRDSQGRFMTADSLDDPAVAGHPKRDELRAYCGMPIFDPEGVLLGTLCHYDAVPRDSGQLDLELLVLVAGALSQKLAPPAAV